MRNIYIFFTIVIVSLFSTPAMSYEVSWAKFEKLIKDNVNQRLDRNIERLVKKGIDRETAEQMVSQHLSEVSECEINQLKKFHLDSELSAVSRTVLNTVHFDGTYGDYSRVFDSEVLQLVRKNKYGIAFPKKGRERVFHEYERIVGETSECIDISIKKHSQIY